MHWLQSLDIAAFRFINQSLSNPVFDVVLPWFSGNVLFVPALLWLTAWLLWKGGARGRVFVGVMIVVLALGDTFVINVIKHAVGRPRPWALVEDANFLFGRGGSGGMPSSHTSTWFAATVVTFCFFRQSWRFMLPVAATVGLSRIYVGVHYPGDVLAGAILGAGYAIAVTLTLEALWGKIGPKVFPVWAQAMPSLLNPHVRQVSPPSAGLSEIAFLRLGYFLIAAVFLFRLAYLASEKIELSKDEAYQWMWSKHLALSYFSKPPGIAFIQFAGTSLWGDTTFGVRFFSPVFAALMSLAMFRFLAREISGLAALCGLLILHCTPLLSAGSVLMTIDPPLVLCWTLAMFTGWHAAKPDGTTRQWLLAGLFLGLGFLCKYTAAYQIICWALFLFLWPPARLHLKRPGPYLALLVFALCTLPVIIWNAQHEWVTADHVAWNAGIGSAWERTLRYFWEFTGAELGLLNPVFLVGALGAMIGFWRKRREHPLQLFFFCLGAPVFLGHWLYSVYTRVQPNWIAPAILPMFCLMIAFWHERWRTGRRGVATAMTWGLLLGFFIVILMHDSNLIGKVTGRVLPGDIDPLRRVRAWKASAAVVEEARKNLERGGKPAFIIANHYGIAGLFSIYLPEARRAEGAQPLVYAQSSDKPENQLFFWPEYRYRDRRAGQNAIYVVEHSPFKLERGWVWKWLRGEPVGFAPGQPPPFAAPQRLRDEFESVTDLGIVEVQWRGRVFRRLQLFECRNLQ